jgi:hypothetical protein
MPETSNLPCERCARLRNSQIINSLIDRRLWLEKQVEEQARAIRLNHEQLLRMKFEKDAAEARVTALEFKLAQLQGVEECVSSEKRARAAGQEVPLA